MTKPMMSDAELKRRRKAQGHIVQTTSTLGLASLGSLALGTRAAHGKGAFKALQKITALKGKSPEQVKEKLKNTTIGLSATAGGIGGLGGYNQAAIFRAESRKRKPVAKSLDIEPLSSEVGLAKNWEPTASKFDPEGKRMNRAEQYPKYAAAGAGAAGVGSGYYKLASIGYREAGKEHAANLKAPGSSSKVREFAAAAKKTRGRSRVLAGVTAGLAGGAAVLHHKKNSPGMKPYVSKSFGDWKTIDQREMSQRRDRKAMRYAGGGAALGTGTIAALHTKGDKEALKEFGEGVKIVTGHPEMSRSHQVKHSLGFARTLAQEASNPVKAGAALVAGSAALGAGAKGHHTYHQHKINERRRKHYRSSMKKSDSLSAFGVDHG